MRGSESSRRRAVSAAENTVSASASSRVPTTRAYLQQVGRTRGARGGDLVRKGLRRDQPELAQPHGLHRARGGADIAGVAGTGQHDADAVERKGAIHIKIPRFPNLPGCLPGTWPGGRKAAR